MTDPAAVDHEARDLARELVSHLQRLGHVDLDALGPVLGLEIPHRLPGSTRHSDTSDASLSKRERLEYAFEAIDPGDYVAVCERFLEYGGLSAELRNRVEDLLWAREDWPVITERVRRDLGDALERCASIWLEADGLLTLVKRHWVLRSPDWSFDQRDPYEPMVRHMFRNPGDWSVVEFFKQIGALGGGDRRFALFI